MPAATVSRYFSGNSGSPEAKSFRIASTEAAIVSRLFMRAFVSMKNILSIILSNASSFSAMVYDF